MENKIKEFLKLIKVNENTISMVLGLGVVVIIATMVINYFRETPTNLPTIEDTTISQVLDDIAAQEATASQEASDTGKLAQALVTVKPTATVMPKATVTVKPTATAVPTKIPTVTMAPTPTPSLIPTIAPTVTTVPTSIPTATPTKIIVTQTPTVKPNVTIAPTKIPVSIVAPSPTPTMAGQIAGGVSTSRNEEIAGTNSSKYTVAKGDNLWKIAEKNYKTGYGWIEIAQANKLGNKAGMIEVGQELVIPQLVKQYPLTVKETATSTIADGSQNQITGDSYTVVKGDNLWNIAVRAYNDGFKWNVIYEANKSTITNPRYIEVGMNLKLPRS